MVKNGKSKRKKKGKKWVEKKTEATKKEKKKENKRNTNVYKRKTHLFPYVPKAEGLLNFLRLHIYMIHPHLPSRKNLPNPCSSRKRVPSANLWISPFRRKIASNWPPLRGAAAWLCNTGWAASGHSGTLRALCGKWPGVLGGVLLFAQNWEIGLAMGTQFSGKGHYTRIIKRHP